MSTTAPHQNDRSSSSSSTTTTTTSSSIVSFVTATSSIEVERKQRLLLVGEESQPLDHLVEEDIDHPTTDIWDPRIPLLSDLGDCHYSTLLAPTDDTNTEEHRAGEQKHRNCQRAERTVPPSANNTNKNDDNSNYEETTAHSVVILQDLQLVVTHMDVRAAESTTDDKFLDSIPPNYDFDTPSDTNDDDPPTPNGDTTDTMATRLRIQCLHTLSRNCIIHLLLRIPTVADSLPTSGIPHLLLTSPKVTWLGLLAFTLLFDVCLVIPGYLASLVLTELGVYIVLVLGLWSIGKFVLRLIAFPGATNRVSAEVETEFSKYSVRMLDNGVESLIDLCTLLITTYDNSPVGGVDGGGGGSRRKLQAMDRNSSEVLRSSYGRYDIIPLWSKVCSYRDRVFGMYYDVVLNLLTKDTSGGNSEDLGDSATNDTATDDTTTTTNEASTTNTIDDYRYRLTKYGNNHLIGDVGNLLTISSQARIDGEALVQLLRNVLRDLDILKEHGRTLLTCSLKSLDKKILSNEGIHAAHQLLASATELKDSLHNFHPSSLASSSSPSSNQSREEGQHTKIPMVVRGDSSVSTSREEAIQTLSPFHSVKMGAMTLLNLIDPPAHESIFGLDVLRGAVLSRYKGARQLWVPRSVNDGGGMIDVLHIPSPHGSTNDDTNKIDKAILFCNPNAGLVEVGTGMSLTGGNVVVDGRIANNAICWTDFYTESGYDIFLFNYCGFGRSYTGKNITNKKDAYTPGFFKSLKRTVRNLLFEFKPSPASVKSDALTMGLHILKEIGVSTLVIHGESIGGMAAASTARKLSEMNHVDAKTSFPIAHPTLLLCDRTFCNLNAVAQRLVGSWTGLVLPLLIPLWQTDVAADFAAANCKKILAQDASDAIIHDAASLKTGLAMAKESGRGQTKGAGSIRETPLEYRMADWEDVGVLESSFVNTSKISQLQAPIWPSDKRINKNEAIHFAACIERIAKVATALRRINAQAAGSVSSGGSQYCEEEGIEIAALLSREAPSIDELEQELTCDELGTNIIKVWNTLSRCDGMTGMPLGAAVKGGYDCVLAWLFGMVTFGCQRVALRAEKRRKEHRSSLSTRSSSDILVAEEDFDIVFDSHAANIGEEVKVALLSLPEVIKTLKKMAQDTAGIQGVQTEVYYCAKMLDYTMARMKAQSTVSSALNASHFRDTFDGFTTGLFINLTCGHNNQYSDGERQQLFSLLSEACETEISIA